LPSLAIALLLVSPMSACGGGGGGGDDAGAATGGGNTGGDGTGVTPGMQIPTAQLPPGPAPGGSDPYVCRNVQVGAVMLDNVFVPEGATCAMLGSQADGTIEIARGGFLDAI